MCNMAVNFSKAEDLKSLQSKILSLSERGVGMYYQTYCLEHMWKELHIKTCRHKESLCAYSFLTRYWKEKSAQLGKHL